MKTLLLLALVVIGLVSCAAPKAIAVAEAPKAKPEEVKPSEAVASVSTDLDDGLRIGDDILALPSEEQLRSSPTPAEDGDARVIVRPPAD